MTTQSRTCEIVPTRQTCPAAGSCAARLATRPLGALAGLLSMLGFLQVASAATAHPAGPADTQASKPIPWSELGAKATAQYSGDGLAVFTGGDGAVRLRCVFQRLEGEVTPEGLWLKSTVNGAPGDRFRVVADYVGRDGGAMVALAERGSVAGVGRTFLSADSSEFPVARPHAGLESPALRQARKPALPTNDATADSGKHGVSSGEPGKARFVRRGFVEEYSVSVDGVRQDFIVAKRPTGSGPLRVDLVVGGAEVQKSLGGAQFVLDKSGRKLAYSRLRAVDAGGRGVGRAV